MKILFVDDEPRILEGIERMLFHLSDEWEMEFVTSGHDALEELEEEGDYEVIVTDMRMPGMDGASLLAEVNKRHPNIVRIVLSGHAEQEAAMRAVPVAHQYLNKPCKANLLQEVVERACGLNALLTDQTVRNVIGHVDKLPSIPRIYSSLTKALSDPKTKADDVAEIVKQDSAMVVKILQLVNSAFFGRSKSITNINQAVIRLGFQMVKNLVLSVEIFDGREGQKMPQGISVDALQDHALKTASIAAKLFADKQQSDDAFMAGMLHDIGKLIIATEMPERMTEILSVVREENLEFHQAELKLYGVTHAEIGAYLLSLWGLPYPIIEAIANHHDPDRVANDTGFDLLSAIYIADALDSEIEVDSAYLDTIGVADKLEEWRKIAGEIAVAQQ